MSAEVNFDWVKARLECSLGKVFETLVMQIEADVSARNQRLPSGYQPFETVREGNRFKVFRAPPGMPQWIAILDRTENGIRVINELTRKVIVEATLTLNNDGECRLKANGKEYEFWQFRRTALEWILFDSIT